MGLLPPKKKTRFRVWLLRTRHARCTLRGSLGAAKHQHGLWLTLFCKPGVTSAWQPRKRVRQDSIYFGDSKVHPHQKFITGCFWVSFLSCAKHGQHSTAVRIDKWLIETYKINSATLFTLLGRRVSTYSSSLNRTSRLEMRENSQLQALASLAAKAH